MEVQITFNTLALLVAVALLFDFMNGFHDAANSIATVVSTGVLKPYQAVVWAAFFNVVALFIFELRVASTVGKGIVDPAIVDHVVIFGALCGALFWNLITWRFGIPSSSSHALIGGLIGATLAKAGTGSLLWLVFGADLFLTVAVEVAFALLMARTLYVVERDGWLLAALRVSWKPLLGALVTAVALGAVADWAFPQADTLVQVLRALRGH